MQLDPISMSAEEIEDFYEGFSNATLWPLYHDVVAKPEFHRRVVGRLRRGQPAVRRARPPSRAAEGATVWVHDYQLQLVPQMLRELRPDLRIGFFLHIPFPPAELFQQLPWRRADPRGPARRRPGRLPAARRRRELRAARPPAGRPQDPPRAGLPARRARPCAPRAFPISIDAADFEELARRPEVSARAAEIREALGNPRRCFLGVDRLDYTKGICARLRAFGELLADGELDVEDAVFVQVATPVAGAGRAVPHPARRHRPAGRPDQRRPTAGSASPAISLPALVLPARGDGRALPRRRHHGRDALRDGMNLVAKEYVACRYDDDGALVLSEFAGAADELRQAWLVNPYDINGMKSALLEAYHADAKELTRRMRAMRKTIEAARRRRLGRQRSSTAAGRRRRRARQDACGPAAAQLSRVGASRRPVRSRRQRVGGSGVGILPAMISVISSRRRARARPSPARSRRPRAARRCGAARRGCRRRRA